MSLIHLFIRVLVFYFLFTFLWRGLLFLFSFLGGGAKYRNRVSGKRNAQSRKYAEKGKNIIDAEFKEID